MSGLHLIEAGVSPSRAIVAIYLRLTWEADEIIEIPDYLVTRII